MCRLFLHFEAMPVWEITGHEFTKHDVHTADGISIRFPRVVKKRFDKTWETATKLTELQVSASVQRKLLTFMACVMTPNILLQNIYDVSKTNAGSRLREFFAQSGTDVEALTPSPSKKGRKRRTSETSDSEISEKTSLIKKPRKLDLDDLEKSPRKVGVCECYRYSQQNFELVLLRFISDKMLIWFLQLLPDLLTGKIIRIKTSTISDTKEFRRHFIA